MASDRSPAQAHVDAIKAALDSTALVDNSRAEIKLGELGQHEFGPPRRILFVLGEGEVRELTADDLSEKFGGWPDYDFNGFDHWIGEVTAHVVAESHAAMWALWQNLRLATASVDTEVCSAEGDANFSPDKLEAASHLYDGARYLIQQFTWAIKLGDEPVTMPGYSQDIEFPVEVPAVNLTDLSITAETLGPTLDDSGPGDPIEFAAEEFEDLYDE